MDRPLARSTPDLAFINHSLTHPAPDLHQQALPQLPSRTRSLSPVSLANHQALRASTLQGGVSLDLRGPAPRYYLANDGLPELDTPPQEGDYDILCATQNVLHPLVAQAERHPANRSNARFIPLASHFANKRVDLIMTQESTPVTKQAFEAQGYFSVDSDSRPTSMRDAPLNNSEYINTDTNSNTDSNTDNNTDRSRDISTSSDLNGSRLHYITLTTDQTTPPPKLYKINWRGLTSYYNPESFQLDPNRDPEFRQYPTEQQKSWSEVGTAFNHFIYSIFSLKGFSDIQQKAADFINSLSGVGRIDGLLVTYLRDNSNDQKVILCNTHLESFDHDIRRQQIDQLISEIKTLQSEHPDALILIAGDFNYPQLDKHHQGHDCIGLTKIFKDALNATTMSDDQIAMTMVKGNDVDGVYLIAPVDQKIEAIAGRTYLPMDRQTPEEQWSDHCSVWLKARLTHH